MTLEFVILPVSKEFELDAYDVENKIKSAYDKTIYIEVDTKYTTSLSSKINKYRKDGTDMIIIDNKYSEDKILSVRFADKGSRSNLMKLDDFIEFIVSLDLEDDEDSSSDSNNEVKNDSNNDLDKSEIIKSEEVTNKDPDTTEQNKGGCSIM